MAFQKTKFSSSHFTYLSLLALLAIFAYWQISFLKYSVTHDMINCWIPWRYYISECFHNHIFPFWNPYQQLGYPIHADLQGPTWYLESILLSMTTGQSNYTLHFLFIFYVFMAGMGMYFLCLGFHTNKTAAFLTGACYMLGGFFVAHVQHFYAIIGAAWIPFIILNYYKMYTEKSYVRALYAAIFMFFNLTGGNHTFSIILIYLCITISAFFILTALKEKKKAECKRFIQLNVVFVLTTLLLASVVLMAFYQTAPYIARLSGMAYKTASACPLSPQSLVSFLLPFSTVNSGEFFNTDKSMCNIYVGSIMLVFIVLAVISKKQVLEKVLFGFAIVCLIASFGSYTPLHKFLFNYFPLIDRFRFPSYFSLFAILIFLLLGSRQLAVFLSEKQVNYNRVIQITAIILTIALSFVVIGLLNNHGQAFFFTNHFTTIFDFINASTFYQNMVLQGSIQLLLLGILITTLSTSLKKYKVKIISILVIADLFISVQLNIANVGISPNSPKELHDYITTLPHDFPIPPNNNIIDNTEQIGQKHGLYRNTSIFHKRIGSSVFNSYVFSNYGLLEDSLPYLFKAMQSNPLLYFSDRIYKSGEVTQLDSATTTNKTIVLSDTEYESVKKIMDTAKPTANTDTIETVTITSFSPNAIKIKAASEKQQLLTLLQSYYKGWEATIDGQPAPIYVSNYLTMSVLFPKGGHEVIFRYKNPAIVAAATVSYTSFLLLLLLFSYTWITKNKNYWAPMVIWCVLIGSVLYYFF
jgi:hypothetical protein